MHYIGMAAIGLIPNPLVAMSGNVLAPEESLLRGDIETIIRASERARDLVKQILAFSRKQATSSSMSISPG
jgi:signal transduction histidine kinase